MKLVTYEINGTEQTGILNSDETWVYPSASFIRPYADMNELIRQILPEERNLLAASAGKTPDQVSGALPRKQVRPAGADPLPCSGCYLSWHQLYGACRGSCPLPE